MTPLVADAGETALAPGVACIALGRADDAFAFWSVAKRRVEIIAASRVTWPAELARVAGGVERCAATYPKAGAGRDGVDWSALARALVQACQRVGPYTYPIIRGHGVWRVPDLGDRLIVNGDTIWRSDGVAQERIGRDVIYEASTTALGVQAETLAATAAEARELLATLEAWGWARPADAMLLLGWMMSAFLTGALSWRAHLLVSGPSGAGGSALLRLLANLLGGAAVSVYGDLGRSPLRRLAPGAVAMLADQRDQSESRLRRLASQLRSARGEESPCASALILRRDNAPPAAADAGRFLTLELASFWGKGAAVPYPSAIDARGACLLGHRLFARMIREWPRMLRTEATLHRLARLGHLGYPAGRLNDRSYTAATIAAAAWVALHDDELTFVAGKRYVAPFGFRERFPRREGRTAVAARGCAADAS